MPIAAILASTDSHELSEWRTRWLTNPWGDHRSDIQSAMICMTLAALLSDGKRKYRLEQFMPLFDRKTERKRQTPEEMFGILKAMAKAQNEYVDGKHR